MKSTHSLGRRRSEFTVGSLSSGTVILYGAVLRDGAGRPYLPHEALELLAKVARVPIYAVTPAMLGRGVVGGRFLDFASTTPMNGHD